MNAVARDSISDVGGTIVRVLLVEDDDDDRELTVELFESIRNGQRYELACTKEYDVALDALLTGKHDVCLLDQFLGAWNGLDLLVDAMKAQCRVPIVFLTGNGTRGVEHRALAQGAADFLVKGEIDVAGLERSIRHSLERARTVDALRDREHQFRSVFEAALDAMLILDDDWRCIDANAAALTLFGVTREELLGRRAGDLGGGSAEGEASIERADGTKRLVEYRTRAQIMAGRHLSVLRDVTERRAAEEHRLRLAATVESAADAIETVSLDGLVEYWSPAACHLYGHTVAEVLGRPQRVVVPEDRIMELDVLLARVRDGEAIRDFETVRRRKDGTVFVASVTISPVYQHDKLVAYSIITRDISEKKKLEAHLAVSDRMASIGTLAAGVAHEINNPLAVVISNLEMVSQFHAHSVAAVSEDVRESLRDASLAADRIRHVVRDLKLFSRPDEERRALVDLHPVIDSSARMAWNEIRHRAKLVKDYGDIPLVEGSEARLGQVILNLLVNAAQAIRDGNARNNEIRIVTRTDSRGYVVVEVKDTGGGIPPEAMTRLFEPFFTTKPVGIGTGLGLSICKRIVQDLDGTIDVESALGQGTTFRLLLPPAAHDSTPPRAAAPAATRSSRRGSVLVLDDDVLMLKAVERVLGRHHDVFATASAADALAQLEVAEYDVILCDMMMPQMSGMDFHEAVAALHPAYVERIVFLTGGAFSPAARDFLAHIPNRVVDKPCDAAQLRALIEERVSASESESD